MRKLDNQTLATYNKMVETEEGEPAPTQTAPVPQTATNQKQSIFSPAKAKQGNTTTPLKKQGAYKTPSKAEVENQKFSFFKSINQNRSASRKAFRSASKEQAIVHQLMSGDKKDVLTGETPIIEAYPDSKEVDSEMKKLTDIVNEKQKLITGVTKKMGEFVSTMREMRRNLDVIKGDFEDSSFLEPIETYF